jgi:hypothetical protein
MAHIKQTKITDPAIIEILCLIQQRFVDEWNKAEMNPSISQTHDLPGGATYTGSKPVRGASFVLPDNTWVCITCKAPWHHWHDGWSFCRNPITPVKISKVVVHGSMDAFNLWFAQTSDLAKTFIYQSSFK